MYKSVKLKESVYLNLEETRVCFLKRMKINLSRNQILDYAIKALQQKIKEDLKQDENK